MMFTLRINSYKSWIKHFKVYVWKLVMFGSFAKLDSPRRLALLIPNCTRQHIKTTYTYCKTPFIPFYNYDVMTPLEEIL